VDPNNTYVEDDKGKNNQPSIVVDSGLKKRKREGKHWGFGGVESTNCGCCFVGTKTGVQTSDVTKSWN
jgi:hypothetical protein